MANIIAMCSKTKLLHNYELWRSIVYPQVSYFHFAIATYKYHISIIMLWNEFWALLWILDSVEKLTMVSIQDWKYSSVLDM